MDWVLVVLLAFLLFVALLIVIAVVSYWTDDGSVQRITWKDPTPTVAGSQLPPNLTTVAGLLRTEKDESYGQQVAKELEDAKPRHDRAQRITELLRSNTKNEKQ